jgi:hypothetical protein
MRIRAYDPSPKYFWSGGFYINSVKVVFQFLMSKGKECFWNRINKINILITGNGKMGRICDKNYCKTCVIHV